MSAEPLESAEIAARRMAAAIGKATPAGWGFIVFLMKHGHGGHATYLSSIERDSAIRALEEWIAHAKGLPDTGEFHDRSEPECWLCAGKQALVTLRGPLRQVQVCADCIIDSDKDDPHG